MTLKEKMTSPKNIKKRRSVQDMDSLFKAITPWIGNVILSAPVNENTFCEGTDPCFTSDKTLTFLWNCSNIWAASHIRQLIADK